MSPSRKRALIAGALLFCACVAGAAFYLHRSHPPALISTSNFIPDIVSELPPDAPGVAYVDVATLRKMQGSTFAAILGLAGPGPAEDRDYQEFVRATGFDYSRDLDRVAIAFWPTIQVGGSADSTANRAIAIADGRFDQTKIKAYALRTGKAVSNGTQSFYEVPGEPSVAFEFLSPTRIAIASGKDATDLLRLQKSAPDPAMQARINRVAAAPIFGVVRTDNLPASFYDFLKSSPQLERMARSIASLRLAGKPAGDGVFIVLEGECDSATDALEISTLLDGFRMLGSMALMDPKTRGQMTKDQTAFLAAVLKEVKVTHEDRFARLMLDVTPEMLTPSSAKPPQTTEN